MQGTSQTLTGCVVESGHGITHIVPVVNGYVIGSCIRTIPIAGRDITHFVQQAIRWHMLAAVTPLDGLDSPLNSQRAVLFVQAGLAVWIRCSSADCMLHADRERGEPVPAHMSLDTARLIKERHCYVASCKDKVRRQAHSPA